MDLESYLQFLSTQPNVPTATELAGWENQRRTGRNEYANFSAGNNLQMNQLGANQAIDTQTLTRRFDRMREDVVGGYAQRGLGHSGIYGRGLQRQGEDRLAAFSQLNQQYLNQSQNLQLQNQTAYGSLLTNEANVSASEQARRADLASQIRGV